MQRKEGGCTGRGEDRVVHWRLDPEGDRHRRSKDGQQKCACERDPARPRSGDQQDATTCLGDGGCPRNRGNHRRGKECIHFRGVMNESSEVIQINGLVPQAESGRDCRQKGRAQSQSCIKDSRPLPTDRPQPRTNAFRRRSRALVRVRHHWESLVFPLPAGKSVLSGLSRSQTKTAMNAADSVLLALAEST
jgi:hypothetical protein